MCSQDLSLTSLDDADLWEWHLWKAIIHARSGQKQPDDFDEILQAKT